MILFLLKLEYMQEWAQISASHWSRKPLKWLPASQFCRYWWDVAQLSGGKLWHILDFQDSFPTRTVMDSVLQHSNTLPLDLSFITEAAPLPFLQAFTPVAGRISNLRLVRLTGFTPLFSSPLPALKSLWLHNEQDPALIMSISFPNIEVLDLGYSAMIPNLTVCHALTTLRIFHLVLPPGWSFQTFARCLSTLSSFEELQVYESLPPIPHFHGTASERFPFLTLQHLALHDDNPATVGNFLTWFQLPETLYHLSLYSNKTHVDESSIRPALAHFNPLKGDLPHVRQANHLHLYFPMMPSCIFIRAWYSLPRGAFASSEPPKAILELGKK